MSQLTEKQVEQAMATDPESRKLYATFVIQFAEIMHAFAEKGYPSNTAILEHARRIAPRKQESAHGSGHG